jgi:hypothetical protein
MSSTRAPLLRRLLGPLRIALALLILGWVARGLPWSDELSYTAPSGEESLASGVIEGEWQRERIAFRFDGPVELPATWPAEVRAAARAGERLDVERHRESEPGYDWHPGMPRAFREMKAGGLYTALAFFLLASLVIVTRWWRLLAIAGCPTSWWNALRLTFLGLFFNNVMPGQTGGDLVKGVLVAKENPGRRADALVTVLLDRVFGMVALAVLALVVILIRGGEFVALRASLLWVLGVCAVGTALYSSKAFRRKTGLSALVDRLPVREKLRSVDRAALLYLERPAEVAVAFAFSFVNHVLVTLGVYFLGGAIGVPRAEVGLPHYLVLVPVANLIGALPLAPGGWGVGELAFRGLFHMIGASPALGVAVSVTFRLCQLALGLVGGVFMLLPGSRSELREVRSERAAG